MRLVNFKKEWITMAKTKDWALILGASSGFGKSTALALARAGYNIAGVHLDRKNTQAAVSDLVRDIEQTGVDTLFFNANASDDSVMEKVVADLGAKIHRAQGGQVKVLLHSLAFGAIRPYICENPSDAISRSQMNTTLDVMANCLVYWTQKLVAKNLLKTGSRIFAMTSEGSRRVWPTYGAVSAAKAALESHIRQLAYELAPKGITANAILAGVTDTPALHKITGFEQMIEGARKRNPGGRLTLPEDVAKVILALTSGKTAWMTGNTIHVDGGENLTA